MNNDINNFWMGSVLPSPNMKYTKSNFFFGVLFNCVLNNTAARYELMYIILLKKLYKSLINEVLVCTLVKT